jgi:hypothetical protein
LKKNLINFISKLQNNVTEPSFPALEKNVTEESSKKLCHNGNNKNEIKLQNKVRESEMENLLPSHLLEQSSSKDNETLSVKNILKIGTPLPLEPSLYSPIHPNRYLEAK